MKLRNFWGNNVINQKGSNNYYYKHGETKTRLYRTWINIKCRCFYKKDKSYLDYGGRGITVCDEWLDKDNGYINFRNWSLNNGYANNLEIDRKNTDGNYEPLNCRFVTRIENSRNKRNTINMKIVNEIRTLYKTGNYTQKELGNKYNLSQGMISCIINNKNWGDY